MVIVFWIYIYRLSFDKKTILYTNTNIDADDGMNTQIFISSKNCHVNFQKPLNILNTNMLRGTLLT